TGLARAPPGPPSWQSPSGRAATCRYRQTSGPPTASCPAGPLATVGRDSASSKRFDLRLARAWCSPFRLAASSNRVARQRDGPPGPLPSFDLAKVALEFGGQRGAVRRLYRQELKARIGVVWQRPADPGRRARVQVVQQRAVAELVLITARVIR